MSNWYAGNNSTNNGSFGWIFTTGGGTAYTLDAQPGAFTLSGQAATTARSLSLNAAAGSFTYTGQAATFVYSAPASLTAESGNFTLSGQAATITASRQLVTSSASFTLTGQAAATQAVRNTAANAGSYTLSGQAATLAKDGVFSPAAGAFAISGQPATFVIASSTFTAGNYTITGGDAEMVLGSADEGGDGKGKSRGGRRRQSRMVYLEHEGKIVVFANAAQADEWLAQQAKPTKKVAGSKARKAQPDIPKTAQVLDTRALGAEFINFAPSEDLQRLLAQNDLRRVLEIHQRIEMQRAQEDEDDIEMLLMVL